MADTPIAEWVLPTSIPFEDLKGKDLEECIYWLVDAMGAKDLEWRTGGIGGGAADGGRDLEAYFFAPGEGGELISQRWWIECKGRAGTVEPAEVKAALNNALAYEGLDYLVIATNTQFSNPTRDWVKEWQRKHPFPKVQLWDKAQLERYLSRHPSVVLRLFSEALSIHGRFQAMGSRFWNKIEFVPQKTLVELWKSRHQLNGTEMGGLLALTANEFANGDITRRPWGATVVTSLLIESLTVGLHNLSYLLIRCQNAGVDEKILQRAFAYLILVALDTLSADDVAEIVLHGINRGEKNKFPKEILEYLLLPILDQLRGEMEDICSSDCDRIMTGRRSRIPEDKDEVSTYWLRLEPHGLEEPKDRPSILLENTSRPCKVGFALSDEHRCPLFELRPATENVTSLLATIKTISTYRKRQAANERLKAKSDAKKIKR